MMSVLFIISDARIKRGVSTSWDKKGEIIDEPKVGQQKFALIKVQHCSLSVGLSMRVAVNSRTRFPYKMRYYSVP